MSSRHNGTDNREDAVDGGVIDSLQLWLALVEQTARSQYLASQLDALRTSASWRVTAPLRALSARLRPQRDAKLLRTALDSSARTSLGAQALPLPEPLRRWIECTQQLPGGRARLLVDVTEVDLEDLGAGIQRVTKRVLVELLRSAPSDILVIPVRLSDDGRYCPAWRFCERFLGLPAGMLGAEQVIVPGPGDDFLGLDFCRRHHRAFARALEGLKQAGVRVLIVVYDLLPLTNPHWFPREVAEEYRAWLPLVAKHADVALCISDHTRQELEAAFESLQLGFTGKAVVVPLGADALWRPLARVDESPHPRILMVGTVEPRKGHAVALDAMERLWADGRELQLVLAGRPGWHSEELQNRIRRHPRYGSLLLWHESSGDAELAELYASADLLLMASMGEGFGLPIAEAGHAGCHLLVRDLSVFREVAGDRARYFASEGLEAALTDFLRNPEAWPQPRPGSWPSWRDCAAGISRFIREPYCDPCAGSKE